jgi:hypothetical protein
MFHRRVRVEIGAEPAWLATAEDVLLHKLYWNRLSPSDRQLKDAAGVFAVQTDNLDRGYLQHWAGQLGISAQLEDIFAGKIAPKLT